MFGSDDITWCTEDKCKNKDCFRNPVNMRNKVGLHSFAMFHNTEECPLFKEKKIKIPKVITQERGWAGHFICSNDCTFRRNTLITCGDIKWIVSTVGCMRAKFDLPPFFKAGDVEEIGANRWYETMAFESLYDEYDDADVQKEINIDSVCGIYGDTFEEAKSKYDKDLDIVANEMHDNIVKELSAKIVEVYKNAKTSDTL